MNTENNQTGHLEMVNETQGNAESGTRNVEQNSNGRDATDLETSETSSREYQTPEEPKLPNPNEDLARGDTRPPEDGGRTWIALGIEEVKPWATPVNGVKLLSELRAVINRHVMLPRWGAEALALWVVHTYAFELRNVTAYLGISSPEKRCGKSTLLELLGMLANRALSASNISPPALFRVIEEVRPTLLIDEADTFLRGNDEMRGILNSGYTRRMAYVMRASHEVQSAECRVQHGTLGLRRFSCWCPKAFATIGRLPDTLMDRCVVIAMQRKATREKCERLQKLDGSGLRRKCARFVRDYAGAIGWMQPELPKGLNDRAADIWEPLLVLANLAGGEWQQLGQEACLELSKRREEINPIGSLLLDMAAFFVEGKTQRIFSRDLVSRLNGLRERTWQEARKGKAIDEMWLAQQLRPYGVHPRTMRIGAAVGKGYDLDELEGLFRGYITAEDLAALQELVGR